MTKSEVYECLDAIKDSYKEGYNAAVDKACEWLKEYVVMYLGRCKDTSYMEGYYINDTELINDFRKAMEE